MSIKGVSILKALFITGYVPTQDDFANVFDSFMARGKLRAAGNVSVTKGANKIYFYIDGTLSPYTSSDYALNIIDNYGLGIELVSKNADYFEVNALNAGTIDYVTISNT